MCQMCDNPSLTAADMRARMFEIINRSGWMVQYVEGSDHEPSFAYTVGLTGKGYPELYVATLPAQESAMLLNEVARRIIDGDDRIPGVIALAGGGTFRVEHPTRDLPIHAAVEVYGRRACAQRLQQL